MTEPITTLLLFTFAPSRRLWAFVAMARVPSLLKDVPGLRFHKMMGTGRGRGFSLRPDWGRYAFLGVWESRAQADAFLADSAFIRRYGRQAASVTTYLLHATGGHGAWDGANPFIVTADDRHIAEDPPGEIAVLTRATIRTTRLRPFWSMVAPVDRELGEAAGLRWSIGMGEMPWVRQATFSVWEDVASMTAFAYGSEQHRAVVRRARQERWYAEELFMRFVVVEADRREGGSSS